MRAALAKRVLPALRQLGLRGSFPTFRRISDRATDLLTFQFDKWGGGFVIELAVGPPVEFVTAWGERIPAAKLRTYDLRLPARARLQLAVDGAAEAWFRYEPTFLHPDTARFEHAAGQVLELLPQIDPWFRGERPQRNVRGYL
jgi:hypothetical protein